MSVVYAREQDLRVEDYVAVIGETSMRDRRPIGNVARIADMLAGANLIVTAREGGVILGLARGIGAGLVAKARDLLGPRIGLTLISEADAVGFYERIGMERIDRAFFLTRSDRS